MGGLILTFFFLLNVFIWLIAGVAFAFREFSEAIATLFGRNRLERKAEQRYAELNKRGAERLQHWREREAKKAEEERLAKEKWKAEMKAEKKAEKIALKENIKGELETLAAPVKHKPPRPNHKPKGESWRYYSA